MRRPNLTDLVFVDDFQSWFNSAFAFIRRSVAVFVVFRRIVVLTFAALVILGGLDPAVDPGQGGLQVEGPFPLSVSGMQFAVELQESVIHGGNRIPLGSVFISGEKKGFFEA